MISFSQQCDCATKGSPFLFPIRTCFFIIPGHEWNRCFIINENLLLVTRKNFHISKILLTWWWWWLEWCVLCVWVDSVCLCLECDWWCCDGCWGWCEWLSRFIWWWDAFPDPWPTWILCGRVELWGAECPWWPGWWPLCDSIKLKQKTKVICKRYQMMTDCCVLILNRTIWRILVRIGVDLYVNNLSCLQIINKPMNI